jgi:osmotically-inducible protein OsmY
MLTDKQLQQRVVDALQWEPSIRDNDIAVAVKDGVVTLGGFVDSFAEKVRAEQIVERMAGVMVVADALKVQVPVGNQRSDAEIAHEVVRAFRWNIQVPDDRIKAKVENGWVTLEGDVNWYYQSAAAERAIRYLMGVRGVSNLLRIKPPKVSTFEVGQKIKDALRRNAELDAERITVEAHDGTVTLKGSVRSYAERRDAEYAAWSAPGVTSVDDRITVNA